MKPAIVALCALLLLPLAACKKSAGEVMPSPTSIPVSTPMATPKPTPTAAPTPEPVPSASPRPVDEEALLVDPEFNGAYSVLDVIPAEDGYFVWYGPSGAAMDGDGRFPSDWSALTWVDALTGDRVPLLAHGEEVIHRISVSEPRHAEVRTAGLSPVGGERVLPVTYRFVITPENTADIQRDPWQALGTELTIGGEGPAVVADARAGINDVSLAFVPPATEKGISAFTAGQAALPRITTRYESTQGAMFITLHSTVLESGELEEGCEDWVYDFIRDEDLRYPYRTPAGSLGADNRFFTKAAISSNGTDTTITLMLTEHADGYTAEAGYLAGDMFPTLRLVFRGGEES